MLSVRSRAALARLIGRHRSLITLMFESEDCTLETLDLLVDRLNHELQRRGLDHRVTQARLRGTSMVNEDHHSQRESRPGEVANYHLQVERTNLVASGQSSRSLDEADVHTLGPDDLDFLSDLLKEQGIEVAQGYFSSLSQCGDALTAQLTQYEENADDGRRRERIESEIGSLAYELVLLLRPLERDFEALRGTYLIRSASRFADRQRRREDRSHQPFLFSVMSFVTTLCPLCGDIGLLYGMRAESAGVMRCRSCQQRFVHLRFAGTDSANEPEDPDVLSEETQLLRELATMESLEDQVQRSGLVEARCYKCGLLTVVDGKCRNCGAVGNY